MNRELPQQSGSYNT